MAGGGAGRQGWKAAAGGGAGRRRRIWRRQKGGGAARALHSQAAPRIVVVRDGGPLCRGDAAIPDAILAAAALVLSK